MKMEILEIVVAGCQIKGMEEMDVEEEEKGVVEEGEVEGEAEVEVEVDKVETEIDALHPFSQSAETATTGRFYDGKKLK